MKIQKTLMAATAIATDHAPHTRLEKSLPFDKAPFGVIGLETALPLTLEKLVKTKKLTPLQFISLFTDKPSMIIGVSPYMLKPGEQADLTLIDPELSWQYDSNKGMSKSANSPFHLRNLTGKVLLTIAQGKVAYQGSFNHLLGFRLQHKCLLRQQPLEFSAKTSLFTVKDENLLTTIYLVPGDRMMLEVERKFRITNAVASSMPEKLISLGFMPVGETVMKDIFLPTDNPSDMLRIREEQTVKPDGALVERIVFTAKRWKVFPDGSKEREEQEEEIAPLVRDSFIRLGEKIADGQSFRHVAN
jgi:hypothetical protein